LAIIKRQNSKNYFSEFTVNGKKYVKSTKTANKALASKIDKQFHDEAIKSTFLDGKDITLVSAMETFRLTKHESPKYQKGIGHVITWITLNSDDNFKVSQIDGAWLHKMLAIRGIDAKPSTCHNMLMVLRGTIKLCKKLGYNVEPNLEFPSVKVKNQRVRFLTVEEEEKLLNELKPRKSQGMGPDKVHKLNELYIYTVALLDLGARSSEVASIKWSNVDFENMVVHIWRSKTSSESVLPLSIRLFDLLKDKKRVNEYVFPSADGTKHRAYTVTALTKACVRAGIEGVTAHIFRHTYITRLLQKNMSIAKVQKMSGHVTVQSLMRYAHLSNAEVIEEARSIIDGD
jgi:integrase